MSKRFLTPIIFPVLRSDPAAIQGSIYFNTDINALKLFDGSNWVILATTAELPSIPMDGGSAFTTLFDTVVTGGTATTMTFNSYLDGGIA